MKYIKSILRFVIFVFIGLFLYSCSGVDLSQRVIIDKSTDWLMCGGSPLQQNIAKSSLEPPFKLLWTYDCDGGLGNTALAVSDAVIFVNVLPGEMQSVDISTGKRIGTLKFLGGDASTSPLLINDKVIVAYSGDNKYSLASYNFLTRDLDWRINLGYVQTSPIYFDTCIYVGSYDGKEYKIGQTHGDIIWAFDAKSQIHSTCAIKDNKLVFGADNGYLYCVNINDGKQLWEFKTGASIFSTPLICQIDEGDEVFFGSNDSTYYALSLDSGIVKWKKALGTKFYSGSAFYKINPHFGDAVIYPCVIFAGIDGNLYSLNAINGNLEWKFSTDGVIECTPLATEESIFFTSFDWTAYCLDGNTGKMKWNYQLEGKGKTTPVIWKNYLFIPADKYIYCFTK